MKRIGRSTDRGARAPGTRGSGRWRRLGILVVCLDLVLVGTFAGQLGDAAGRSRTLGIVLAGGGSDVDPLDYLGAIPDLTACKSAALKVGEGRFVMCDDWSGIASRTGTVRVVSLYAAGNAVIEGYEGSLPQALSWRETIGAVEDSLGMPSRITDMFGTPTLVYMYRTGRYGSLELQFDGHDQLFRVNASLTR